MRLGLNSQGLMAAVLGSLGVAAETSAATWYPVLKLRSREAIGARLAQPFGDVFSGTAAGANVSGAGVSAGQ